MSKFKLGDLIRPKKNPTYLPDEVRIVSEIRDDSEYGFDIAVDVLDGDGSMASGKLEKTKDWQPAYPVPILVGDTVKINHNAKLFDMLTQCQDQEIIRNSITLFIQEGCSSEYKVVRSDDGLVFVDAPYEMPVHACLFNLVERAEAKVITHAEIETALGFRFELEDE